MKIIVLETIQVGEYAPYRRSKAREPLARHTR